MSRKFPQQINNTIIRSYKMKKKWASRGGAENPIGQESGINQSSLGNLLIQDSKDQAAPVTGARAVYRKLLKSRNLM